MQLRSSFSYCCLYYCNLVAQRVCWHRNACGCIGTKQTYMRRRPLPMHIIVFIPIWYWTLGFAGVLSDRRTCRCTHAQTTQGEIPLSSEPANIFARTIYETEKRKQIVNTRRIASSRTITTLLMHSSQQSYIWQYRLSIYVCMSSRLPRADSLRPAAVVASLRNTMKNKTARSMTVCKLNIVIAALWMCCIFALLVLKN